MKIFALSLLTIVIVAGVFAAKVSALQTLTLTEGATKFVDISQKDLNVIKVPTAAGLKAYTTSRILDVKVEGDSIYINLLDKTVTAPQELFVVAGTGTYLLMLTPKGVPAEMVVARIPAETLHDAEQWEKSQDHVSGLKELIKAMYLEIPPMGFSVTTEKRDATTWLGTQRQVVARYTGASLEGEVHELKNVSDKPIRVVENEFYDRGVLSVSIERYEIPPGERTAIYIVSRSATQREMDKMLKKYNPLDVLGGGAKRGGTVTSNKP
ncbi:MAG: type-F conjugative transfer system secretin TraK [Syntrophus sp. (in: bacteria)]